MAETSKIAWTDATFNPWLGCTKVHTGCTHCYAEAFNKRTGKAKWGDEGTRIKTSKSYWRQPLKWDREAKAAGIRKRVFCASLADVFEDWTGPMMTGGKEADELRYCPACHWFGTLPVILRQLAKRKNIYGCPLCDTDEPTQTNVMHQVRRGLFYLIDQTPNLDWLLLTKRPENIRRMWASNMSHRPNVWLGTSISNQETADKFVPELRECRDLAPVLFLSAEPLLGSLNLDLTGIDQVIVGVESSGPRVGRLGAIHSEDAWLDEADLIVAQCADADVAAFVKQVPLNGKVSHEPSEWRPSLRVREMPGAEVGVADAEV